MNIVKDAGSQPLLHLDRMTPDGVMQYIRLQANQRTGKYLSASSYNGKAAPSITLFVSIGGMGSEHGVKNSTILLIVYGRGSLGTPRKKRQLLPPRVRRRGGEQKGSTMQNWRRTLTTIWLRKSMTMETTARTKTIMMCCPTTRRRIA